METGIFTTMQALISDEFGIDEAKITPTATFGDLKIDSLDIRELAQELGEKYSITFPEDLISTYKEMTMAEMVAIIENLIG